jgi:uncharacterized Zn finger protein
VAQNALIDFDPTGLEATVGETTYRRGQDYARRRMAVQTGWDHLTGELSGVVQGSSGYYNTVVQLSLTDDGRHEFITAECSCPVGIDCKHAVALTLSTTRPRRPAVARVAERAARR